MAPRRKKATSGKRKRQTGKGVVSALKRIHSFVKDKKVISKALRLTGHPKAANAAAMLGYGRKRKRKATSGKRVVRFGIPIANIPMGRKSSRTKTSRVQVGTRTMRGRGIVGKIAGGLLSSFLPF